jgi:hypothetical protein
MKKILMLFFFIAFLSTTIRVFAQQEVLYLDNVNPILSIAFPENWKCERKGDYFQSISADLSVNTFLWEDKKSPADKAVQNLDKIVEKFIVGFKGEVPKEITKNGIKFTEIRGRGKVNNQDVTVQVNLCKIRNKSMVLLFYASPTQFRIYAPQLENIRNSIQKK